MIGQSVSHYRVVSELGKGGMGVVYRAIDERIDRPVALKFLAPYLTGDLDANLRFQREARVISHLDHQNICTIYEVDQAADGRTFIAMACYDGTTVKDRIASGPMDLGEIVRIGSQIAEGLAEAHSKSIVHRDLKPANILITENGGVKIVDFGLARLVGQSHITRTGERGGTAAYMAPEQVRGDEADHRADIWALGAVLYEMAAGKAAFPGDYAEGIMFRILYEDPASTSTLPTPLARIIERCLQKDPDDRFQSALDVRDALMELTEERASISGGSRHVTISLAIAAFILLAAVLVIADVVRPGTSTSAPAAGRHVAVLPFRSVGETDETAIYSSGLWEVLTSKLTQLDEYSDSPYWVVPASEVLSRDVSSPDEARRAFGVNFVVDGSVRQQGDLLQLILTLIDAKTLRQIDSWVGNLSSTNQTQMQNEAVIQVGRMLDIDVGADVREDMEAGGTTNLSANRYYVQARGYLQRYDDIDNIDAAIGLLHRAIEEDPQFVLAYAGLAEAHWRRFEATNEVQSADSALVYGRIIEDQPDVPAQVYVSLGVVYDGSSQHQRALQMFQRALELDSTNVDAYRGRGKALEALQRYADAESSYRHAVRLKPDFWATRHDLGGFYISRGQYARAEEEFQREVALTPDNYRALNALAGSLYHQQQLDAAREAYSRSIEMEPTYVAYTNLGTIAYHEGRFEEAIQMFRRALQLEDSDHRVWAYLGSAYTFTNRDDSARASFQQAIRMAEPVQHLDRFRTLVAKAGYAAAAADSARSVEYLEEALAENSDPDGLMSLQIGEAYEILGRRDEALVWIERTLAKGYDLAGIEGNRWLEDLRKDPRYASLRQQFQE